MKLMINFLFGGLKAPATLVVMASLASACAIVDPHNMIGRQLGEAEALPTEFVPSPTPATLGAAQRERAFDFVWQTIDGRYHDASFNGTDWKAAGAHYRPLALAANDDDAFWDTLDKMTGELKDAHTRVESPKRVELRKHNESITLGFSFAPVEDKLAITGVFPDSDAWWAGVRPGMTLVAIGGEPAPEAYEKLKTDTRLDSTERSRHLRAVRNLMTGALGSTADFSFERGDGTRFNARLSRRRVTSRPSASYRVLPSGFGYVRFTEWTLSLAARAAEGVEALMQTPGLVIDLRGNPGGSVYAVNELLSRFFPHRTEIGRATTRTGRPISMFLGAVEIVKLHRVIEANPQAYKGPVVVLVNALSASGSELFAATMQATGRAAVVGEPSCGCLLGFLGYARIPGGGELAYSEVGVVMSNGKRIEGEGVIPDRSVSARLADLQQYRDRALEEALQLLATMKPWTK